MSVARVSYNIIELENISLRERNITLRKEVEQLLKSVRAYEKIVSRLMPHEPVDALHVQEEKE